MVQIFKMLNYKKIIITGGAGFIGSNLIKFLLKNTNCIIFNIDNLTYASNLNYLKNFESSKKYSFFKLNICNFKKINKVIQKIKPDYIIHLAAESHVDNSIKFPDKFISSNIIGTYNMLKATVTYWSKLDIKNRKKFRFLHVSTDEVYGDLGYSRKLFNEKSNYNPSSPYSASKASSDLLVKSWGRTYKLPYIITHSSNNYGPSQNKEKFIPMIINNALRKKPITIYGDGKQKRDWIFVNDNVNALYSILIKSKPFETYCIGGSNSIRNIDLVKKILKIINSMSLKYDLKLNKNDELIKFVLDRKGHDRQYALSINKIYQTIKWKPKKDFDAGLKHTIEWYIEKFKT